MSTSSEPQLRSVHPTDKYGTKLVNKAGIWQEKAQNLAGKTDDKGPAGGYDSTPLPQAPPGYTLRITFHRAVHLPFSDFPTFSTDPYIHATFKTALLKRHKQDPDLFLRTPTIHRNTDPIWETQWVIAHVPATGFHLKCRLYDEDPADHDDRLGNAHIRVEKITDDWQGFREQDFDLKKRMGSKRAYTFRGVAAVLKKGIKMNAHIVVSVENLGRSPGHNGGRCFTVAPLPWTRHHSPLIGRIAGTKDREQSKDGKKSVERYNFQAIQMQLRGPVPAEMYHRYVEFKPFIAGMFTDVTLRGRILNRALHHQHARIYNYDTSTIYGVFEKPCIEMTQQFLEFCHYDQGGRIYTYVLSLDGLLRFTETGKEFGIDMLSKHTMHSDVSIYIAFSGEFFIRRLRHGHGHHSRPTSSGTTPQNTFDEIAPPSSDPENDDTGPDKHHDHDDISKDPADYELIIDNDSGTYRPNKELLSLLKAYLMENFVGLKVATLDCQKDEEKMKKLKGQQRERKKSSGKQITYMQNSSMSSLSSSDEEELDARANGVQRQHGYKKQMAKLGYGKKGLADSNIPAAQSPQHQDPLSLDTQSASLDDQDSRDLSSSVSEAGNAEHHHMARGEEARELAQGPGDGQHVGYTNDELPGLLRKNADGHLPRPAQNDMKYGEPETGDNRPAGGIVYNKIVSTASVEKGCMLGIGPSAPQREVTG